MEERYLFMRELIPQHIKQLAGLVQYKAGKPIEELERELGIKNSIKMASNENPLGPSKLAIEAIQKKLSSIHYYPDGNSYYLKNKLAEKLGTKTTNLFIGNGSNEVIEIAGRTFMEKNSHAVIAEPSFAVYKIFVSSIGGESILIPLKDFKHDLIKMAEHITDKTKMIFIANPNNPTGTIVKKKEMDAFLKMVPDDIVIIMDEAYYEYVDDPDYPETFEYLKEKENLIIIRTFSKIYGLAGLRIGYGIGSEKLIGYMERVRQPFNVNLLAQIAATAALDDDEHIKRSREINKAGKNFLYSELKKLGLEYVPSDTNFILIKVPNSADVYKKLLLKGVIVRMMDSYNLNEYLRVTIGLPSENKRFIEELKKIYDHL